MTIRAVVIGIVMAAIIGAIGFFNDLVMHQTFLFGSYMPIFVYGVAILFVVSLNPLLAKIHDGAALKGAEIALIIAMMLPASYVSGRTFIHHFTPCLMSPRQYSLTKPGWQKRDLIRRAPPVMLAGVLPEVAEADVQLPADLCERLSANLAEVEGVPERKILEALDPAGRAAMKGLVPAGREGEVACRKAASAAIGRLLALDDFAEHREALRSLLQKADQRPRALCEHLLKEVDEGEDDASGFGAAVAEALTDQERASLRDGVKVAAKADAACAYAARWAINSILSRADLFTADDFKGMVIPKEAEHVMETGVLHDEEQRRLNRHLIDVVYSKHLHSLAAKDEFVRVSFMQGMGVGTKSISWSDVPWYAWRRTLVRFWIPLVIAFALMFIGLALVANRQFAEHEHLPYPIVTFAKALLPEEGSIISSVLKNRLFWGAAIGVALLHVNNYAQMYYPEYLVNFPTWFDFTAFRKLVPVIERGGDHGILHFNIYFTCIGFAYFIASDVALSVGLAPLAYSLVSGTLAGYGISLYTGGRDTPSPDSFIKAGAFFGMFLIIVYAGRYHYLSVFKRSLGLRSGSEVLSSEIWGARVFLISSVVAIGILWSVGVSLLWATLFFAGTVMVYVATSRVVAETGSFLLQPHVYPSVLIWGFVGGRVLGPTQLMILMMVGAIFNIGTHVQIMPMTMHSLRLSEERPARTASLGAVALIVALLVAIPVALYLQYDVGSTAASDGWTQWVPNFPYDPIVRLEDKLEAQGTLAAAGTHTGIAWFKAISPYWPAVAAFFVALVLVLGTEFIRLRWAKWPVHPVLFIFAGWWHSRMLAVSFLLGWLVKAVINKYGGAPTYRKMKPLMMGLIAGDMLGGIIITVIGTIYYYVMNEAPKGHWVLPG